MEKKNVWLNLFQFLIGKVQQKIKSAIYGCHNDWFQFLIGKVQHYVDEDKWDELDVSIPYR